MFRSKSVTLENPFCNCLLWVLVFCALLPLASPCPLGGPEVSLGFLLVHLLWDVLPALSRWVRILQCSVVSVGLALTFHCPHGPVTFEEQVQQGRVHWTLGALPGALRTLPTPILRTT